VVLSNDPTHGPQTWTVARVDPADKAAAISCASLSMCVLVASNGDVVASSNPTGGAAAWTVTHADTTLGFECGKYGDDSGCDPGLASVSCPTVSFCAAIDSNGNVITSTNPAATAPTWTISAVNNPPTFGFITCPSARLCVDFTDYSLTLAVSANPGAPDATWAQTQVTPGPVGVSCSSATLCVAYDGAGNVMASGRPAGAASAWKLTHLDAGFNLSVTCSAGGLCIGFDPIGNAFAAAAPTRGRYAWSRARVDDNGLTAASCPSQRLCVAGDGYGNVVVGRG
jgi:hypothetical protein